MTHASIVRLRKLAALSRRDAAELLRAQWALLRAQLLVWTRPVGALVSPSAAPAISRRAAVPEEAIRIAVSVRRAAEHGLFRPACLVRSVALQQMLEARSLTGGQIQVGVRWCQGQFGAHAWVEYNGQVLGDHASRVRGFDRLTDISVVRQQ